MSKTTSQNEQIRQHLEAGNTITPLEALSKFNCLRLGARIHNLKQIGLSISSDIVKHDGKWFAQYSLAKMLVVGLIMFSSCVTQLQPGCAYQRHNVRMRQLNTQYTYCTSAGDDWTRPLRNWWERPQKMTRIPFTKFYIP